MSQLSINLDGFLAFWSLSQQSSQQVIESGWGAVEYKYGKMAPKVRTPEDCLKEVLSAKFPKAILRPLTNRDGFAVLQETRYRDDVQTVCTHAISVDEAGTAEIRRGYTYDLLLEIEDAIRNARQRLTAVQVANALIAVTKEFEAVSLRPSGGFYWMPLRHLTEWQRLVDIVEVAALSGANRVYRITHAFDAQSIRAVRDALLSEADNEATKIIEEVDSGELGERALKNRAVQAQALAKKVEEYERILGESLPTAQNIAQRADLAATAARITATSAAAA